MLFNMESLLTVLSHYSFLITLIIGVATVLGVWLGPIIAARWQLKRNIVVIVEKYIHEYNVAEKAKLRLQLLAHKGIVKGILKKKLKEEKDEYVRREMEILLAILGDKRARSKILSEIVSVIKGSYRLDELRSALSIASLLELKEICPLIFERLKQERDSEVIKLILNTLTELNYVQAMPFLLKRARECKDKNLMDLYYSRIGDLARKNLNNLPKDILNEVIDLFIIGLKEGSEWLIDAITRVDLPSLLKRKEDIDVEKKNLVKVLCKLLNHKDYNIRGEAAERLIDLGDPLAVTYLKERLKVEQEGTVKWKIQRALKILSKNSNF